MIHVSSGSIVSTTEINWQGPFEKEIVAKGKGFIIEGKVDEVFVIHIKAQSKSIE
jgi:hypothetical protein